MAPLPVTDDYYMVLEVGQSATHENIIKSYKRLALKLHPDRNVRNNTTKAFQLLGAAFETLKDESKRQAYDLIYPFITHAPHPSTGSTPQPEAPNEAAQIAALQRSKQERGAQWRTKKNIFDSSILELQKDIRCIDQEIKNLESIFAAEAAVEAQKNSWTTWLLSPISKNLEETEEEKACKDRKRQERRIEKDMKERRLALKKADLKREDSLSRKAKQETNAADLGDDGKIRVLQAKMYARDVRERQERQKVEREREAKVWKQQQEQREKREREAAEAWRNQQAEKRTAEQNREHSAHFNLTGGSNRQTYTSSCLHNGWWPKIQGHTACPRCDEIWTYLLQCPDCNVKVCPRCQAAIRPRIRRDTVRTNLRNHPRVRTPSPDFDYDYSW